MTNQIENINPPANIDAMVEKGKLIYAEIQARDDIEKLNTGKYIAIDINSRSHFIGETRDEAVAKAKLALPDVIFFIKRIGGVDTVARRYPFHSTHRLMHARLL